jgi:hypothetical protein
VHELYHSKQGINSYNYKGIGRTGFTLGLDEYADTMAAYVATHFHIKKQQDNNNNNNNNSNNNKNNNNENDNANDNENNNATDNHTNEITDNHTNEITDNHTNETTDDDYNHHRRHDNKRRKDGDRRIDKEKMKADKRRRKSVDYREAYYYVWNVLVRSISLFDEFPLTDPTLLRLNRYLTTLLHRELATRATNHTVLKRITRDRWQVAFCGVAKRQNDEEDQVLDLEKTRERKADLYVAYSVNGGEQTKKVLRDPHNFEPMCVIECLLEGEFEDGKVERALNYMLQNGIDQYRPSPGGRYGH